MCPHPVVDDLYTRQLERRDVDRGFVDSGELLHREAAAMVLDTTSKRWRSPHWHAEGDKIQDFLPRAGGTGRLRIDAVADDVFRIRYAEGDAVPENVTPMCIGAPPPPTRVEIQEGDGRVVRTPRARLDVALASLQLRVHDEGGHCLTEIGGPEKNHFHAWDAYNTGICRTRDDRPLAVECFSLRPGEGVFGFGEKFLALDKVGQTVDLNMVEAMGTTTPRSYKNIPFFWTTGGWGVFLHHSARITCWVGSRTAADLQVAVEDDFLDSYLFVGSPKEILARYTDLTGRSAMPPRWSFGFWQSKISYRSAEEALEVVRKNREHAIPTDVLHLDTHWFRDDWRCDLEFDPERFPDPSAFTKAMAELGAKLSLWQLPYIPEGSTLFDELLAVAGFVETTNGELYDVGLCYTPGFRGRVGCIDFTNPEAAPGLPAAGRLDRLVERRADRGPALDLRGGRPSHPAPRLRDGAVIPLAAPMDHVDQRPPDALTLRIAPFREDGSRELRIPTTNEDLVVRYAYAGGRHRVDAPPGPEVVLDVVGRPAPAIDLR